MFSTCQYAAMSGSPSPDDFGGGGLLGEPQFNDALAAHLRTLRPAWREDGAIVSERTGVLLGRKPDRPDILIVGEAANPIAVETE